MKRKTNSAPLEPFSFQNVTSQSTTNDAPPETAGTESRDDSYSGMSDPAPSVNAVEGTDPTPTSDANEVESTSRDYAPPDPRPQAPELIGTTLFAHHFKTRFLVRLNRFAANLGLSVPDLIVSQFSRYLDDVRLTAEDIAAINASESTTQNEEG